MNETTHSWWTFLCAVAAFNVLAWTCSTLILQRQSALLKAKAWPSAQWHVLLSAGYVLGCAYRSVFPVFDVQRVVMIDSWLSSVVVGRSVATVAELCFAAQWALLARTLALAHRNKLAATASRFIVPLILIAEVCSWYSVVTTSNIGHVLEESLWGLSAALLVASLLYAWPRSDRAQRPVIALGSAVGLVYVIYMFEVDVPMYWARWIFDESQGHHYLDIAQGLADVSSRWLVSHRWADWETEMVWMSLYFSVAVWLSIGLAHASQIFEAAHQSVQVDQPKPSKTHLTAWVKSPLWP